MDRRDALRLLGCTPGAVLESLDGGTSWAEVLTPDHFPGIVRQSTADPDLWVATGRSTICISEDDAASWREVTAPEPESEPASEAESGSESEAGSESESEAEAEAASAR